VKIERGEAAGRTSPGRDLGLPRLRLLAVPGSEGIRDKAKETRLEPQMKPSRETSRSCPLVMIKVSAFHAIANF